MFAVVVVTLSRNACYDDDKKKKLPKDGRGGALQPKIVENLHFFLFLFNSIKLILWLLCSSLGVHWVVFYFPEISCVYGGRMELPTRGRSLGKHMVNPPLPERGPKGMVVLAGK